MHAQRKLPPLDELVARYKDEVTQPAGEVLKHLYEALLAVPEIKLSDGRTAKVEVYYPPEADGEDRMNCGVDVRLSDGNMLEFTLKNTGWERSFVQDIKRRSSTGRQP